jgi:hypothetical protein
VLCSHSSGTAKKSKATTVGHQVAQALTNDKASSQQSDPHHYLPAGRQQQQQQPHKQNTQGLLKTHNNMPPELLQANCILALQTGPQGAAPGTKSKVAHIAQAPSRHVNV